MGIDWMGMGGNGNIKNHSRSSLLRSLQAFFSNYDVMPIQPMHEERHVLECLLAGVFTFSYFLFFQ